MKYIPVYQFRWLIVIFLLALIYFSNLVYFELPFIGVRFLKRTLDDGLYQYLTGFFPRFDVSFFAYNVQTLIVWSTGIILGSRVALISLLIYLFLGFLGLPLFAFGGGFDYFKEPTFGYLISLPLNAYLAGYFFERGKRYFAVLIPIICTHLIGIIYLLIFNNSFLDFTWHLSFSMIGYDLIFTFILILVLPLVSFFLDEITMQEIQVHEPISNSIRNRI